MTRLHLRLVAAAAAVVVVCGLMVLAPARATPVAGGFRAASFTAINGREPVPPGFEPSEFSATNARDWWVLGTVHRGNRAPSTAAAASAA